MGNVLEKVVEENENQITQESLVGPEIKGSIENVKSEDRQFENIQFGKNDASHVYEKYKKYQKPENEIEWIGLPLEMALKKQYDIEVANNNPRYSRGMPLMEFHKQQMHSDSL